MPSDSARSLDTQLVHERKLFRGIALLVLATALVFLAIRQIHAAATSPSDIASLIPAFLALFIGAGVLATNGVLDLRGRRRSASHHNS